MFTHSMFFFIFKQFLKQKKTYKIMFEIYLEVLIQFNFENIVKIDLGSLSFGKIDQTFVKSQK
jgi:hypothetical protein